MERTNSEIAEGEVTELANIMIEGKDVNEYFLKKSIELIQDEEATPDLEEESLQIGTLLLETGIYEGKVQNGKPHGRGKLRYNVCFFFLNESFLNQKKKFKVPFSFHFQKRMEMFMKECLKKGKDMELDVCWIAKEILMKGTLWMTKKKELELIL